LDGADVEIRAQPLQGLGHNGVVIGDTVVFLGRHHQQRSGRIIRLNDKVVSVICGQLQRRVAYRLLHRVLDSSTSSGDARALEILDADNESGSNRASKLDEFERAI
jgi:hypothetical protein